MTMTAKRPDDAVDREHRDRDHAEHGGQRVEEQAVVDDAVAAGVPVVVPGRPAVDAEDARLVAVGRVVDAAEAREADARGRAAPASASDRSTVRSTRGSLARPSASGAEETGGAVVDIAAGGARADPARADREDTTRGRRGLQSRSHAIPRRQRERAHVRRLRLERERDVALHELA